MVFKLERIAENKSIVHEEICFNRIDYLKLKSGGQPSSSFEDFGCQLCLGHNEYCARYFPTTIKYNIIHNSKPHEDSMRRKK